MSKRVVVVTGATSGIGEAIAWRFATSGDDVVMHGLADDEAENAASRLRDDAIGELILLTGDLREPEACERLVTGAVDRLGRIDVLINNAGRNVFTGVLDSDLDDWNRAIDLNLRTAWLMARAAVPHMPSGSCVINVSSNHAFSTMPGCFPYNVAKAGLVGLTTALAVELASRGIRANTICPGWTETPPVTEQVADPDERRRVERLHLTGRIGTPGDVAEAAWYLAGAGQVTGTQLVIDGGRSALMEDPR